MQNNGRIAVVNIKLSASDILRALRKVKDCGAENEKIAAIFHSEDLEEAIDKALISELGIEIIVVEECKNYDEALKAVSEQGYNVIVGCDDDLGSTAAASGLTFIKVTPGRESLFKAFESVDNHVRMINFEFRNNAMLRACFDGIIIIDERGGIVYINETAEYLLGCRERVSGILQRSRLYA